MMTNCSNKIVQDLSKLRIKSGPVESASEAKEIIEQIESVLNPIAHGIGLAAMQIGILKTVGVIKRSDKPLYLINPEVLELEDEFVFYDEACLSLPGKFNNTKRYKHVTIKNYRIENDELVDEKLYFYYSSDIEEAGDNRLTAIAVQHEMEHFDGKLISDHHIKTDPIRRSSEKIGRNDPCSCGSGKKYKKCCGK